MLLSHFFFFDGAEYQRALLERNFTSAVIWASFFFLFLRPARA